MTDFHYSGVVGVEIQGPRVLDLVDLSSSRAVFHVIGFDDRVKIRDFRRETIEQARSVLNGGEPEKFPYAFCKQAAADIKIHSLSNIEIELHEGSDGKSQDLLWIAVGLRDSLPAIRNLFRIIEPLDDGSIAAAGLASTASKTLQSPPDTSSRIGTPRSLVESLS